MRVQIFAIQDWLSLLPMLDWELLVWDIAWQTWGLVDSLQPSWKIVVSDEMRKRWEERTTDRDEAILLWLAVKSDVIEALTCPLEQFLLGGVVGPKILFCGYNIGFWV